MSAVQAKLACWQIRINQAYDNTALDDKEKADMSAQSFGSKWSETGKTNVKLSNSLLIGLLFQPCALLLNTTYIISHDKEWLQTQVQDEIPCIHGVPFSLGFSCFKLQYQIFPWVSLYLSMRALFIYFSSFQHVYDLIWNFISVDFFNQRVGDLTENRNSSRMAEKLPD